MTLVTDRQGEAVDGLEGMGRTKTQNSIPPSHPSGYFLVASVSVSPWPVPSSVPPSYSSWMRRRRHWTQRARHRSGRGLAGQTGGEGTVWTDSQC